MQLRDLIIMLQEIQAEYGGKTRIAIETNDGYKNLKEDFISVENEVLIIDGTVGVDKISEEFEWTAS
jgi:hypothetical protein